MSRVFGGRHRPVEVPDGLFHQVRDRTRGGEEPAPALLPSLGRGRRGALRPVVRGPFERRVVRVFAVGEEVLDAQAQVLEELPRGVAMPLHPAPGLRHGEPFEGLLEPGMGLAAAKQPGDGSARLGGRHGPSLPRAHRAADSAALIEALGQDAHGLELPAVGVAHVVAGEEGPHPSGQAAAQAFGAAVTKAGCTARFI